MRKVLVTGVFDLLHVEHQRFLARARVAGDYLVVGVESDRRVGERKGRGRPVLNQEERKEMLAALKMVDEVIILPEDFDQEEAYRRLLRKLKPAIYAVSENSPGLENKRKICQQAGVELRMVHRYNPEYSTSKLIAKIKQKR